MLQNKQMCANANYVNKNKFMQIMKISVVMRILRISVRSCKLCKLDRCVVNKIMQIKQVCAHANYLIKNKVMQIMQISVLLLNCKLLTAKAT